MSTPFEQGRKDGQWTQARVKHCGFGSAKECLDYQEIALDEAMEDLASVRTKDPDLAQKQSQYQEGMRAGMRESLRRIIERQKNNANAI